MGRGEGRFGADLTVAVDATSPVRSEAQGSASDGAFWGHGGRLGGGFLPDVSPEAAKRPPESPPGPDGRQQGSKRKASPTRGVISEKSALELGQDEKDNPFPARNLAPGRSSPTRSLASLTSVNAGKSPARVNLSQLPGLNKSTPKVYKKKDRTKIVEELEKLKAARAASWAPYAMVKEPATEEQRRQAAEAERARVEAMKKARRARKLGKKLALMEESSGSGGMATRPDSSVAHFDVPKELTLGEAAKQGGVWDMDPDKNREGEDDLVLDDARAVRAPGWSRVACLKRLALLVDVGDEEVFQAAIEGCADSEGDVRVAAVRCLGAASTRGNAEAKRVCLGLLGDVVANVRKEACLALVALADLGNKPSKQLGTQLTFTSLDVVRLKRDKACIEAIGALLTDKIGCVRKAAAETLDKINPGWQRHRYAEIRQDDGNASPRTRRPLPDIPLLLTSADDLLWNRRYTSKDLVPEKAAARDETDIVANTEENVARMFEGRYTKLAGQKYNWYMEALRNERQVQRFEESKRIAKQKTVGERIVKAEAGSRGVTTEWMGIEWVDRTKRLHLGEEIHPLGDGIDDERDHVGAPYTSGYNGFGTPLGYAFI